MLSSRADVGPRPGWRQDDTVQTRGFLSCCKDYPWLGYYQRVGRDMAVRVERVGSKASCYIIGRTLRLAHGRHFIFMSAGLPIPFPLQMSKEGLNKLFGRTVSKLETLKQTTTYTRSLQHHRRGQGSDAPADVERRAQVSPIFTPHQPQGLPTGLHKSPEFSRCRSESMSQLPHGLEHPLQNFQRVPTTGPLWPSPHTHISASAPAWYSLHSW